MADLLDELGKKVEAKGKSSDASVSDSTSGTNLAGTEGTVPGKEAGQDLTDTTKSDAQTATPESKSTDDLSTFDDASTWTKDSALLEVKKAREEAKARRLQLKETEAKFQEQLNALQAQMDEKLQSATEAQKELEALKAKDEDKKRSMEEKLAHREALVAEKDAKLEAIQKEYDSKFSELQAQLKEREIEREAQLAVYKERITEELQNVSEEKRKFAEMIVKGHEDPRDAWAALSEAKVNGLFEEKQVVVSHATPGADAARMTKEKQEAAAAELKKNMKPMDLIREGLKSVGQERGNLRGKIV
jgi:delta 1-pyrroline-5-carboxylate dehydrogenase